MRRRVIIAATGLLIANLALSVYSGGAATAARAYTGDCGIAAQDSIPLEPSELTATEVTSSSITISWRDNSSDEVGFKIERCGGSNCTDFVQIGSMPAGVTNITDWGLGKNKTFKYRVRAYNAAGDSAYSNIAVGTTTR
ncbi:MAG TPA: fibronectin type III domain-containing protein [Pyrinomonadaceae bacterium]|jgi:hypothetical protein|nr:fibronectin type III domain-containing protein [Pyrinomonadaceae bacterium]